MEIKQKKQEEKLKLRELKRKKKEQVAQMMKEYNRKKEDLELEDLQVGRSFLKLLSKLSNRSLVLSLMFYRFWIFVS